MFSIKSTTGETLKDFHNKTVREVFLEFARIEQSGIIGNLPTLCCAKLKIMGLYRRDILRNTPLQLTSKTSQNIFIKFQKAQTMVELFEALNILRDDKLLDENNIFLYYESKITFLLCSVLHENPLDPKELDSLFENAQKMCSAHLIHSVIQSLGFLTESEILATIKDAVKANQK